MDECKPLTLGRPKSRGYTHWQRDRVPLLGARQPGHAWLAQHYKWVWPASATIIIHLTFECLSI